MLYSSLYVLSGFKDERNHPGEEKQYGQRVRKTYGKAHLPHVLATEMQESTGRILLSGT